METIYTTTLAKATWNSCLHRRDTPVAQFSCREEVRRAPERRGTVPTAFTFPFQPSPSVAWYRLLSGITSSVGFSHVFLFLGSKSAISLANLYIFVPVQCVLISSFTFWGQLYPGLQVSSLSLIHPSLCNIPASAIFNQSSHTDSSRLFAPRNTARWLISLYLVPLGNTETPASVWQ